MPGVRPPGMDRPDTNLNLQIKKEAEPMIENTRPELHEIESETEQRMRADFMHAWSSITRDPEGYAPTAVIDYAEYSNPWLSQEYWSDEWAYLSTTAHRWQRNPDRATRALEVNRRILSPVRQRSEEQARYIAEHGIERDEYGLLTSHYVTRVDDRAADNTLTGIGIWPLGTGADIRTAAPVPVSSAFAAARTRELTSTTSPLANHRPGNALAASLANAERDGAER